MFFSPHISSWSPFLRHMRDSKAWALSARSTIRQSSPGHFSGVKDLAQAPKGHVAALPTTEL